MPIRLLSWLVFAFILAGPLACVALELLQTPSAWNAWREADRVGSLMLNSTGLAVLTLAIAVPLGTTIGILLERSTVPGRGLLRGLLLVALFWPLPVIAVAWQVVLGTWLPSLALTPGQIAWRPWNQGLLPAAWVHGVAAVPWVAWIVAASLRHTDIALEDQARITAGNRGMLRWVIGPRVALAVVAAAGVVVAQTSTEIAVTDAMMVRTFAEEVYTQLVAYPIGVAAAMAVTVPVWLLGSAVAIGIARPIAARFLPAESVSPSRFRLRFQAPGQFLVPGFAWLVAGALVVLPYLALIVKAGTAADGWSLDHLATQCQRTLMISGRTLASGVLTAILAGVLTTLVATAFCWQNRHYPGRVVAVAVVLALTPGPLIGFGLKELITHLLTLEESLLQHLVLTLDFPPIRSALYDQPSPLPGVWVAMIRFFPVAVAILYPTMRVIPTELDDLAKIDGHSPWQMVGWPMTRSACFTAAVAVGILSLGEVSATKLVVPPQLPVFILELFDQMHYGTESTVAALCLVQATLTGVIVWLADSLGRTRE